MRCLIQCLIVLPILLWNFNFLVVRCGGCIGREKENWPAWCLWRAGTGWLRQRNEEADRWIAEGHSLSLHGHPVGYIAITEHTHMEFVAGCAFYQSVCARVCSVST